jgi:hypothetical protein
MTIFSEKMRIRQCPAGSLNASPAPSNIHLGEKRNRPEATMISDNHTDWAEFAGSQQNFPENAE